MLQSVYEAQIDPYFRSWGVEGTALGFTSRRYEGERAGRRFQALLSPRRRTRYAGEIRTTKYEGHTIDLAVSVAPSTRFVAALSQNANVFSRFLNRRSGVRQVTPPPELAHLEMWAKEPEWVERWLAQPGVSEGLGRLLAPDPRGMLRNVALSPLDGLSLKVHKMHIHAVSGDDLHSWLADLFALAAAVDRVAPPRERLEASWFEKKAKESPWMVGAGVLAIGFAVVVLAGVLFSGSLIGLAYFLSR